MKFMYAGLLTLAAGTFAAPEPWCWRKGEPCGKRDVVPEVTLKEREALPEPEPWCWRKGEPCGKKRDVIESSFPDGGLLKRAAYGFVSALHSTPGLAARAPSPESHLSNLPGGAAFRAKRGIDELSSIIALASRDPKAVRDDHALGEHFARDTDVAEQEKREASPWCWRKGEPCGKRDVQKKREAAPWCWRKGEPCGKRDVLADRHFCGGLAEACFKAKRAAEAVVSSIGDLAARNDVGEQEKREVLEIQQVARDLLDSLAE